MRYKKRWWKARRETKRGKASYGLRDFMQKDSVGHRVEQLTFLGWEDKSEKASKPWGMDMIFVHERF